MVSYFVNYEPKRVYAFYTDDEMRAIMERFFEILSFDMIPLAEERFEHFQAMTLRKDEEDTRDGYGNGNIVC